MNKNCIKDTTILIKLSSAYGVFLGNIFLFPQESFNEYILLSCLPDYNSEHCYMGWDLSVISENKTLL